MPVRLLRDGILTSLEIDKLSTDAELFYRRLMSVVDDFGRFHGHPAIIKAACYPLRVDKISNDDVSAWLDECIAVGVVNFYPNDGKPVVELIKLGSPRAKVTKFQITNIETSHESKCFHMKANESNRLHLKASESNGKQVKTNVPYSYSYSYSNASSSTDQKPASPEERGLVALPKADPVAADAFAAFWKAYPRRVGKGAAESAWKKVPAEAHAKIMAAIEDQKKGADWIKDNGQFIPHPSTWLNQKRWEDDSPLTPALAPGQDAPWSPPTSEELDSILKITPDDIEYGKRCREMAAKQEAERKDRIEKFEREEADRKRVADERR